MPDLCQLDDVKDWLGISLDEQDDARDRLLSRLVTSVSTDFLNETRRQDLTPATDYSDHLFRREDFLASRVISDDLYGRSRQAIFLRHYPVNSIASVKVNGEVITQVTDPSTESGFWFDATRQPEDRQKFYLIGNSFPWFEMPWPWSFFPNIEVTYNGGYDEVPTDIVQAVIEWIGWKRGYSQLQGAEQTGAWLQIGEYQQNLNSATSTLKASAICYPDSVRDVIERYTRTNL